MDRHLKNEKNTNISLLKTDVLKIMVAAEGYDTNDLLCDILHTRMGTEHLGEIIEQILTLVKKPIGAKDFSILQVKLAVQRALLEYKLQGSHAEVLRLIPNSLETCGVIGVLQGLKDMIDTHSGDEEHNYVSDTDRCSTNSTTVVSLNEGRILCETQQQRMETDTSGNHYVVNCPNVQQNNRHDQSDYETASQLIQLAQPQDLGSGMNQYQFSSSARPAGGSMLQLLNSPQTSLFFSGEQGKSQHQCDGRSGNYVIQAENRSRDSDTTTDNQSKLHVTVIDKNSSTSDSDKSYRSRKDKGDDSDCTTYRVTVEEPSIRFYENDMNIQLKVQKHTGDQVPLFSSLLASEKMVCKTTPKVEYSDSSEFASKRYSGESSSLIRDCIEEDHDASQGDSDYSLEIDLEYNDETHGDKDFSNVVAQEMEVSTSVHQSDHDPKRLRRCKEDQEIPEVPLNEADITSLPEADMARVQEQSMVRSSRRHSNWFITHKCRFCKDLGSVDFKNSETVRQLPKSTRLDKIRHHISTLKPKVKRGSPQRKSISNIFRIPYLGGQAHRVCRDTFVKYFGICRDTVVRLSHGLPTGQREQEMGWEKTEHKGIDGVHGVRDIDDLHETAQIGRASHTEETHANGHEGGHLERVEPAENIKMTKHDDHVGSGSKDDERNHLESQVDSTNLGSDLQSQSGVEAQSNEKGSSGVEDKVTSIPPDQAWAVVRNDMKNFLESKVWCLPANNDYCRKKYEYYLENPDDIAEEYKNERGGPVHEELVREVAHSIGFTFGYKLLYKSYYSLCVCRLCKNLKQKVRQETNGDWWQQQLNQHKQSAERVTSYCQRVSQGGEGDPGELALHLSLMDCTLMECLPCVIGVRISDMKRHNQSCFIWEYIRAGSGTHQLLSCLLCYLKHHLQEVRTHRLVLVTEPYGGLLRNTDLIVFGLWVMVHFHIDELCVIYQYHSHRSDILPHPVSTQAREVIDSFINHSSRSFKPLQDIISDGQYRGITSMTSDVMFDMSALKEHEEKVNWEEIQVSLNTTRCLHMKRRGSECVVRMEKYFSDNVESTADDNRVAEYSLPMPSGENELSPLYPSGYRIPVEYYNKIRDVYPRWEEYYKKHAKVDWSDRSKAIVDPSTIIQETDGLDDDDDDDYDDDSDDDDD